MTNLLKKLFVGMLLLLPAVSFGQTKIAHVNSQTLLENLPEAKTVKAKLDTLQTEYEAQYDELLKEYKMKLLEYQNNPPASAAMKKSKELEIQQLQERIESFEQSAAEDFAKMQEELLTPVHNKVKDAIKAVAKESGYAYVIDTNTAGLLYASDSEDITAKVKAKLGLK